MLGRKETEVIAGTGTELERFHSYLSERLANGGAELTPEEALDLRRMENPTPEEHAANVAAVREAIADMDAGDSARPYKEVPDAIDRGLQLQR
jgi:hypothetical protein